MSFTSFRTIMLGVWGPPPPYEDIELDENGIAPPPHYHADIPPPEYSKVVKWAAGHYRVHACPNHQGFFLRCAACRLALGSRLVAYEQFVTDREEYEDRREREMERVSGRAVSAPAGPRVVQSCEGHQIWTRLCWACDLARAQNLLEREAYVADRAIENVWRESLESVRGKLRERGAGGAPWVGEHPAERIVYETQIYLTESLRASGYFDGNGNGDIPRGGRH